MSEVPLVAPMDSNLWLPLCNWAGGVSQGALTTADPTAEPGAKFNGGPEACTASVLAKVASMGGLTKACPFCGENHQSHSMVTHECPTHLKNT